MASTASPLFISAVGKSPCQTQKYTIPISNKIFITFFIFFSTQEIPVLTQNSQTGKLTDL
jgi:hypothetical protein